MKLNEAKEQKGRFLSMSFGTLGVILLGNLLVRKCAVSKIVNEEIKLKSQGRGVNKVFEGQKLLSKSNKI